MNFTNQQAKKYEKEWDRQERVTEEVYDGSTYMHWPKMQIGDELVINGVKKRAVRIPPHGLSALESLREVFNKWAYWDEIENP